MVRPSRPEPIPSSLWQEWVGTQDWKRVVVDFFYQNLGEEFTVVQIKKGAGLHRSLLSDRISSLARKVNGSGASVQIKFRQEGIDEPPYRLFWRMESK